MVGAASTSGPPGAITITGLKWVPPFAAGQVRDHRARWILNEAGWDYDVRLLNAVDQASDAYRDQQPFGQIPVLEEDGRPTLFESGAIVIDVATRAGILLPEDADSRSLALSWVFAALNTVEPPLMNVAEVEYFFDGEGKKAARRPDVYPAADTRLFQLEMALGDRHWLVGDSFTVADLMMGSVLRIASRLGLLEKHAALAAYHDRCVGRPACRRAIADQCAAIERHDEADMRERPAEKHDG